MSGRKAITKRRAQKGIALLLCLFALLLLSAIGMALYISSGTEVRIAKNYGSNLDAYYSAKSGLQEVRDRVSYASSTNGPPGGLADKLPTDVAGNANGVLYVVNPTPGETVDPTDPGNRYFDDQLCHEYNSGADAGTKCTAVPGTANWSLASQTSLAPPGTLPALKWVRINMKTNRSVAPNFCLDQPTCSALDTPVCFDGKAEQILPAGSTGLCDANGMQNVYMLTALAVTPGLSSNSGRRLLRSEVVAPGIRPPGAITMDAANSTAQLSDGHIPGTAIDGRPHKLDGTLTSANSCSAVASLATENAAVTSQLQQALDSVRQGIVNTANASCNADGTSKSGNICTYGLWWVRGTGSTPRFVTGTSTSNSGSGGSGDNSSPGGSGSHDDKNQLTSTTSTACDPSNASCYTNLDLSAPQLLATANPFTSSVSSAGSPFIGGPGNQSSGSMYQSPLTTTYPNEISALSALVKSSKGQSNYFEVSPAALAPSYGTQGAPAIVNVVNASSLTLQGGQTLTGYGLLVVPNDMEINGGTLNWTGIVLVQAPPGSSGTAQFKVTSGTGFINGALLLQSAGSSTASLISTLPSTSSNPAPFKILYSCQAIDMAFGSLPFKVLGSSEMSF